MNRRNRYPLSRIATLRRLALRLGSIGLPLLAGGCMEPSPSAAWLVPQRPMVARGAAPESLPAPKPEGTADHGNDAPAAKVLPIALDAVLHLAETQNLNVAKARAKVDEAEAKADLAHKKCLPLRKAAHDRLEADLNVWQQKAELSKLTADTLQEAGSTYVDLVAARTGQTIAEGLLSDLQDLLTRASNLAKTEPAARVEAARIQAEIEARQANVWHFQAQAAAASAKLIYLLGLDPCTELVPIDRRLLPIDLIDVAVPTCELVAKTLNQGPGIRELEGMIGVIEDAIHRIETHCLIDCLISSETRRMLEAQRAQIHLAYEDLRAKLTAGVQESRATILHGLEEIRHSSQQARHSGEARRLSKERLENNVMGSSPSEVLLSLQSLGGAQLNHLSAVRDYNKAQIRLLILTNETGGPGGPCPPHGGPAPSVPHPAAPVSGPAVSAAQLPTPRRPAQ